MRSQVRPADRDFTGVFERFSLAAREVIGHAADEARSLGHVEIGPEHILIALLGPRATLTARVLESMGVAKHDVRHRIARLITIEETARSGPLRFTSAADELLASAPQIAAHLGANVVGCEHILVAVARSDRGVVATVLADLNVGTDALLGRVMRELIDADEWPADPAPYLRPVHGSAHPSDDDGDRSPAPMLRRRERRMLIVAIRAAVLTRSAFTPARTRGVPPLEIQILAHLALAETDPLGPPATSRWSLWVALACNADDLDRRVTSLERADLVRNVGRDDAHPSWRLTGRGQRAVLDWLGNAAILFSGYPNDHLLSNSPDG